MGPRSTNRGDADVPGVSSRILGWLPWVHGPRTVVLVLSAGLSPTRARTLAWRLALPLLSLFCGLAQNAPSFFLLHSSFPDGSASRRSVRESDRQMGLRVGDDKVTR